MGYPQASLQARVAEGGCNRAPCGRCWVLSSWLGRRVVRQVPGTGVQGARVVYPTAGLKWRGVLLRWAVGPPCCTMFRTQLVPAVCPGFSGPLWDLFGTGGSTELSRKAERNECSLAPNLRERFAIPKGDTRLGEPTWEHCGQGFSKEASGLKKQTDELLHRRFDNQTGGGKLKP